MKNRITPHTSNGNPEPQSVTFMHENTRQAAHSAKASELWNNLSAHKDDVFPPLWIGYPVHKLSLAVQYRTAWSSCGEIIIPWPGPEAHKENDCGTKRRIVGSSYTASALRQQHIENKHHRRKLVFVDSFHGTNATGAVADFPRHARWTVIPLRNDTPPQGSTGKRICASHCSEGSKKNGR